MLIPMSKGQSCDRVEMRERLVEYLRSQCASGNRYFKSKYIAEDVALSASEIGALIPEIEDSVEDLTIEQWGYTKATTWRIVRQKPD